MTNSTGIDRNSGDVIAAEGTLSPQMTRSQFISSPLFDSGDFSNESEGWYTALAKPLTITDQPFGASLLFKDEQLHWITLWSADQKYGRSWDDWSEEGELVRDAGHRAWLNATLGAWNQPFGWGEITAGYDSKTGGSSITIRYFNAASAPDPTGVYAEILRLIRDQGSVEQGILKILHENHMPLSDEELLAAIHAIKRLVDTAEELADAHRRGAVFERNAKRELRKRYPGFKSDVYESAWAHALFITR